MSKLKKYLLRFLLIPALIYIMLTTTLTFLFKDKLIAIVDQQVEKNIETEVSIGDINLSFLTAFPYAELRIKDLYIEDKWEKTLVKADLLGIRIGLFSLLGEGLKIQSVILKNGISNIVFDKKGNANFDIFKTTEKEADSDAGDFKLKIRKALLKNMNLRYLDKKAKHDVKVAVQSLEAGGDFSTKQFDLNSIANMNINRLMVGGTSYLSKKEFAYTATLNIDLEEKVYTIDGFDFSLDGGAFFSTGEIVEQKEYMDLNLEIGARDGDLGAVFAALPDLGLGGLESTGSFDFLAKINGPYSASKSPVIEVRFGLKDGTVRSNYLDLPLEHVSFQSDFIYGHPSKDSRLTVEEFYAEMDGEFIEFDLDVLDLESPVIDLSADASVSGRAISGLIGDGIKARGNILLEDIKVKGKLKDMQNRWTAHRVQTSGAIDLDNFSIKGNGHKVLINSGGVELKNNVIRVQDLSVNGADVDLICNGTIKHLWSVITKPENKNNYIGLDFKIDGTALDIDNLISLFGTDEEEEQVASDDADNFAFIKLLDGTFQSTLKQIKYGELDIENFTGKLEFDRENIQINGSVKAMEGKLDIDGNLAATKIRPVLTLKVDCEGLNATEMFRQMGEFGQEMITSSNVSGKLNSKMVMILPFERSGSYDMESLKVYAGIGIENGELKGIEMLEDFSKIIHLDDLRHIRFVNMENWLEISNGNIYIPTMFIQSNAINLKLSGMQGFDEKINYNFKVNAGQIIAEKVKGFDSSLDPIAAKEHGFFNLYFNIYGDLNDMAYKASKRIVSEQFGFSEERKQDVRYALEKAFGPIDLIKEPSQWADLGDFELMEGMEEDVEYIDGF